MDQSPYNVRQEEEDGYAVYVLEDAVARSQVWVAPALGMNAYRFGVETDGRSVDIFEPPAVLSDLAGRPSGWGMPVLFPFPGRIAQGRFAFGGRRYQLPVRQADGHACHGFAYDRTWQVVGSGPSAEQGAVLVGRLESANYPELKDLYPSAFRLDMTFRLRAWTLTVDARAENVGDAPLPVGYGLHPYFRTPFGEGESRGGCLASLPVSSRWELDGGLITGRILPLDEDVRAGVPVEGRTWNDVYTGVRVAGGESRAVLADTAARLGVVVAADASFTQWVVYAPPEPALCLEPWTCVPNAINLQDELPTGLITLAPGEAHSWQVRITVRPL